MKINEHTALSSRSILLVPYSPHHVPTYHQWMQDPDLQAATASEPLSLEEEYAMQRSWRSDSDKLTFIICQPRDENENDQINATKDDSPERMIGDINLFLFPLDSSSSSSSSSPSPSPPPPSSSPPSPPPSSEENKPSPPKVLGEIEIMIAHKTSQRKGHGRTALVTFLDYVLEHWSVIGEEFSSSSSSSFSSGAAAAAAVAPQLAYLRVKVHETNMGSIRLFETVGFQRVSETANYFGEIEMRWYTTGDSKGGKRANELPYRMRVVTDGP